jgi:ABC-type transport system substrate-binding protein
VSATASEAQRDRDEAAAPLGTVNIFDPHPLNWLFVTWNTMEEPVRTDHEGYIVMALAENAEWRDDKRLEVTVRAGARFQDGEPCTADSIKQNFDEVQRWAAPHPPGTFLNFDPDARCVVEDERTCVFHFPEPDGLALGKFRGFHIASPSFWHTHGFGYKKTGSGEGHW